MFRNGLNITFLYVIAFNDSRPNLLTRNSPYCVCVCVRARAGDTPFWGMRHSYRGMSTHRRLCCENQQKAWVQLTRGFSLRWEVTPALRGRHNGKQFTQKGNDPNRDVFGKEGSIWCANTGKMTESFFFWLLQISHLLNITANTCPLLLVRHQFVMSHRLFLQLCFQRDLKVMPTPVAKSPFVRLLYVLHQVWLFCFVY